MSCFRWLSHWPAWSAHGKTPGKVLAGVAIWSAGEQRPARFSKLLGREIVRGWLMIFLFVPSLFDHSGAWRDPLRQTWHDRQAGTVVVRDLARRLFREFFTSLAVFSVAFYASIAAVGALIAAALS